ncbi:MAG: indolepyruvate ferredoxin oxidoreductase subunit alpha [Promethearchaeota archaeon]
MLADVLSTDPGRTRAFMLANEAIARGALEAGVKVAAFYPGSPVSEILDTFGRVAPKLDIRVEIATNEKVALEVVAGAAMSGLRAFTAMKSVGLNVASDAFFSLAYVGVGAGLVLVVADDPYCHSSQNEEDGRFFAPAAQVPMLEPANAEEAKAMVIDAFDLSERFSTPVVVRTTTRVNHQSAVVPLGPLKVETFRGASFRVVGRSFATVGARARELKLALLERAEKIEEHFEDSAWNVRSEGGGGAGRDDGGKENLGVLCSGVSAAHVAEATRRLGVDPPVLKLGTTWPLPRKLLGDFLAELDSVLVVEELSPHLEVHARSVANEVNPGMEVYGKLTGHFSQAFEYDVDVVEEVLARLTGKPPSGVANEVRRRAKELQRGLPPRIPVFCPGCPHRATFWALQRAVGSRADRLAFMNDIGCYSMLLLNADLYPKLHPDDFLLSMGSCLGAAAGVDLAGDDNYVMAVVGDSTFFHASLPGLVNLLYNGHDVRLLVLDNSVTAMTGQQPNPGTGLGPAGEERKRVELESVVRGMGFENVLVVDPFDAKVAAAAMREFLGRPGPSVVISRGPCALWNDRNKRGAGEAIVPYHVDASICRKCHTCMRDFYCPAISMEVEATEYEDARGKVWRGHSSRISADLCNGCGVCSILCPYTDHEAPSESDVIKRGGGPA